MDIEGRLHSAHRRSQMTMTKSVQTAGPAVSTQAIRRKLHARFGPAILSTIFCLTLANGQLHAQTLPPTGPQQLSFAGLLGSSNPSLPQSQINAISIGAQGNLYLLLDQKDGVRLLKTDPAATTVLAQTQIGAKGDVGLAMALDPAGNIYVTGTTTSGTITATPGAAFTTASGSAINSFIARFDANLNILFVSFTGGSAIAASSIAATADSVFITGSIFAPTLPVTPAAIIQTPAYGSSENGFVEKFSTDGSTLRYATYLSGASGNTAPAAIAADSADNAYIAGTTTSPGYPTIAALIPEMLGATSGFLTRLTPAGDGITFSTYISGAGITSLAIDPVANNLLLSGSIALGQFPVATVSAPLAATTYQVLLRLPLDGSAVLASTVLAPGPQSLITPGPSGTAWAAGSLSLPLLPLEPLSSIGNSFAIRVNAENQIDQTARFGGIAALNPGSAGAPVTLTSIAVDSNSNAIAGGSFAPYAGQTLLATQTFDLPLTNIPNAAFSSTVRAAVLPASACNGSLCSGSAAYLATLATPSPSNVRASLALSVDDSPNITLRNLGSTEATSLQIAITGFTFATNCGPILPAGDDCSIALTGTGPGTITASAANATTQTQPLPALASGVLPQPIVFAPKELDFGIVTSAGGPVTRTITITNLTQQSQTFTSALDISTQTALPYTLAETASDCTQGGASSKLLAPGGVCHVTIGLTASNSSTNDGPIRQNWLIGSRDVQMTAFDQAAPLSLSSPEIDFGTQYTAGLRIPRYLYLSNNSTIALDHTAVTFPGTSPFSVVDRCPSRLEPLTVCQLQLAYQASRTPSTDSVTLSLDQGLTALVTGRTLPQPSINGSSVNPNLSVSATSLTFANIVPVTSVSTITQPLTIQNTGATAFTLSLILTGDFTDTTNCGAVLAGGASCSVVFSFIPSQPGTRQGLLAVTAGAGTSPAYITLSGIGAAILSPANNGTLNFGGVIAGQPLVQWFKITQPFTSLTAATTAPFTAILVEDLGFGHGQPPTSAFTAATSGTCLNCWLAIQFAPQATGLETGTLTLTSSSSGSPYVLSLTGNGLPLTGLLLTPLTQDFGPVPVKSTSGTALFTLTNLVPGGAPIAIATPTVSGDFAVSTTPTGGAPCGGPLAYTASCFIAIAFSPTAIGPRTGTLSVQAGSVSDAVTLIGYGSPDPGLSLSPTALAFNNIPGSASTQQTIVVTNTSVATEQIGAPIATTTDSATSNFSATSTCGSLAPSASCSIAVTFQPATAPSAGTLAVPVTTTVGGAPILATYTVPLTGAYTTQDAGLAILPNQVEYGPQTTGAPGVTRQFTIDNLTAKSVALTIALPRQFVFAGAPCSSLAPNASCNFSVTFLPLTNGDITGTLAAQATPTDGSSALNGTGYVEGYGIGSASLSIPGASFSNGVLSFGQVPSGQSAQRVLTFVNNSATSPLTIRRVTSQWPFLSTTTCSATLAPMASCTVTLAYAPVNQIAAGSNPPPSATDSGTLIIESDAASSPDLIDLTGSSTPVTVSSPSNSALQAAVALSQSSLTFANTTPGAASAPQTVTLSNTGTAPLSILGIQTTPDFTISTGCSNLVPGASCPLTITFAPQPPAQPGSGSGTRAASVEISSNASTSLEFISLTGVSSASTLALYPASLSFGSVLVGTNSTLSVQLTNTGFSPATIASLTATGDYSVTNGTCPATLNAGANCAAQVTLSPTQSGSLTGTLSIANSATTAPLTVALAGTGIQPHMQISPSNLSYGSIAVGAASALSLTVSNTGSAPLTNIAFAVTGDYAITQPCSLTTLDSGSSCPVTITFTPTAAGARAGTLSIASSDPTSPANIPLTGTGTLPATFTFTVSGAATASATVTSGYAAGYNLSLTPLNGFTGAVVLNCTPVVPASYAGCSLLPSSVTLSGSAQNAVATITTVTSIAAATPPHKRTFGDTAFCLLFPAIIFTWKARTSRHRAWRTVGPIAWAIVSSIALLSSGGCGSNSIAPSNLRYTAPGAYQYQVTASATGANSPLAQTVTLNLTVQ
jgi:trimeric autotransporter adhesin